MALEEIYEEGQDETPAKDAKASLSTEEMFRLAFSGANLAEHLSEEELRVIAQACWDGYQADKTSQKDWEDAMGKAAKLAMQVAEVKSEPFDNASNVKVPILTVGSLQFASRAGPALLREPEPVKGKVNGQPTQAKLKAAKRIGKHMSFQVSEQIDGWMEGMDELLHILPIWGCAYKKTYYADGIRSDLVWPENLVFYYYAKSVEHCRRKTETFLMHRQEILEKQRRGQYREFGLDDLPIANPPDTPEKDKISKTDPPSGDENTPFEVLEQHTFWDLDGDGYQEPWVITFIEANKEICSIRPRFDQKGVQETAKSFVIEPEEFYTGYNFFPDPTGGVRGLGWGHILFPINEAVNTLVNQLVDAGRLNNQQGGIIDERLAKKWPSGTIKIKMNEWVKVNGAMFQDIKNGMLPWPTKAPSTVLFQLLGLLIGWAQRLTTVTDTMAGENPPTNQPATTTMALLEQGQKVFAGVHKRAFRSLSRELKKIKRLNRIHLKPEEYFQVLDATPEDIQDNEAGVAQLPQGWAKVYKTDYDGDDTDVSPSADPSIQTEAQLRARSQAVLAGMQGGLALNPMEAARWYLDSWDIPEADQRKLLTPPPQQTDPKLQIEAVRQDAKKQKDKMDGTLAAMKLQMEAQDKKHKQAMDEHRVALEKMGKNLEAMRLAWDMKQGTAETVIKAAQAEKKPAGGEK